MMSAVHFVSVLLICCYSETITFTETTSVTLLSSSIGYNIDKCTFTNYLDENGNYYHWYTQSITNFTETNVYNDMIQQFNIKSNNLTNELPHIMSYDPSDSFSTCSSLKRGDIISCYSDMSCCGACNYINCNLFINNNHSPFWQSNQSMITDLYKENIFNKNLNIQCMNDGYLVSWIKATRLEYGFYTNFSIKYSTLDLNGNIVILNKYLYNFSNLYIDQGTDTFSVSIDDDLFIMSYMNAINDTINYIISTYHGISSGLQIKQIVNMIHIKSSKKSELPSNTSVYNTMKIEFVENECCFISLFKVPMDDKMNLMLNMVNDNGLNVLSSSSINGYVNIMSVDIDNDVIYDADIIEMKMIEDKDVKYILVLVSYMKRLIGFSYGIQFDIANNIGNVTQLNTFDFVNNNNDTINDDYWYSICMNILNGSNTLFISWIQNRFNLLNGDMVNAYAQTWNISKQ